MRTNELMLGDWVLVNEIPKIVSHIWSRGIRYKTANGVIEGKCYSTDLDPIPLTPKIIENAGFSQWVDNNGNNWSMIIDLNEIYVVFGDIDKRPQVRVIDKLSGDSLILTYCGFVHELQYALKVCVSKVKFKF